MNFHDRQDGVTRVERQTSSAMVALIVFIFGALSLVVLSWHIITETGLETSDFAANSILIQSAKHWKLTLGNYSRIGFNHPGPAILYVLAGGEALFHDALGVTTAIGGQLVAADIYNAAWLAVCVFLLLRMMLPVLRVFTIMAVTIAVVAIREPHNFNNI